MQMPPRSSAGAQLHARSAPPGRESQTEAEYRRKERWAWHGPPGQKESCIYPKGNPPRLNVRWNRFKQKAPINSLCPYNGIFLLRRDAVRAVKSPFQAVFILEKWRGPTDRTPPLTHVLPTHHTRNEF